MLGSSMTGPDPSLFSEAEGWEEVGTRVTARSRLSILAGGHRQRILENRSLLHCWWPLPGGGGLPIMKNNCQWFFWEGCPEGESCHKQAQSHGHQWGSPSLVCTLVKRVEGGPSGCCDSGACVP